MKIPSYGKIWEIAWPIMLTMLAQNIINLTDTAFLGHLGEVELGASAIGGLFYFTLFMLVFGFGTGVQILIARRQGEGKYSEIGKIFDNSLYFLGGLALLLIVVIFYFSPQMLKPFIASAHIYEASIVFLKYRIMGLLFAAANVLFRSFFSGIALTRHLSIGAVMMASVNVIFNYLLIFGNFGFPQMGIAGAGIASSIGELTATVYFVIIVLQSPKYKKYNLFRFVKFDWENIRTSLSISIYTMLQSAIALGAWFVFFMFVEKLGERSLAISNIIRSLYTLLMIPGWAFATTVNTLVSQTIGARQHQNVLPTIYKILKLNISAAVIVIVPVLLFTKSFIQIYTLDQSLIMDTVPVFYVVSGAVFLFSIAMIFFNSVLGTGNTNIGFAFEFISIAVYLLGAWYFCIYHARDVVFAWFSEYAYMVVMGTLAFCYLKYGNWQERKI